MDPWVGKIPWRREWLPIPGFLPGEFHGLRNLVGCSPWGHKESGTIERLTLTYLPYSHQGMLQQRGDSLDGPRTFRERMDSPGERPWEGGGIHQQTVGEPGEGACGLRGTRNSHRALRLQTSSDTTDQDPCPQPLPSSMARLYRAEVPGNR